VKKHIFSLSLFTAVGLAVIVPEPVSDSGFLRGRWLAKLSIAVILFLQGLSLATRSLTAGYRPFRLHGFVLLWNFVGFPAVVCVLLYPFSSTLPTELLLGFGALAFLPTTIASATAYTGIAGGNVANSIVSTVLSNVLAVFIVPAVSIIYFRLEFSVELSLGKILSELTCVLLAPLILGQLAQKFVRSDAIKSPRITRCANAGIILFVVYLAFARSMNTGIFEQLSLSLMTITVFTVVFLLLVASVLVWMSASWLKLKTPQRVAAFYCASQKSLATGLPIISSVLLAIPAIENTALLLIPLLCFHPLQMLFAGFFATHLRNEDRAVKIG